MLKQFRTLTRVAISRLGMSVIRTSIRLDSSLRTTSVQVGRKGERRVRLLVPALILFGLGVFARAEQFPEQRRQEARGWLELEQDQRTYRERVEPLAPADAAAINSAERQQRLELRELQAQQRRDEQIHRRISRDGERKPLGRDAPADRRRDLDRQRLEMRLQRENLGR